MNEILNSTNVYFFGGAALITIALLIGVLSIRSGNRSKYLRLKRRRVEIGWKWIFASIGFTVIFGGVLLLKPDLVSIPTFTFSTSNPTEVSVPKATSVEIVFPIETIEQTSILASPTTTLIENSATPTMTQTNAAINTPTGPVTSTMRPSLTPSLTNTLAPTFTPFATMTSEPTWTQQVMTPTVTNTRAPTATEPAQ